MIFYEFFFPMNKYSKLVMEDKMKEKNDVYTAKEMQYENINKSQQNGEVYSQAFHIQTHFKQQSKKELNKAIKLEYPEISQLNKVSMLERQQIVSLSLDDLLKLDIPKFLKQLNLLSFYQTVKYFNIIQIQNGVIKTMQTNIKFRVQNVQKLTYELLQLSSALINQPAPNKCQIIEYLAVVIKKMNCNDSIAHMLSEFLKLYYNTESATEKYAIVQIMKLFVQYPNRTIQYFLQKCNIEDINLLCKQTYSFIHSNIAYTDFQFNYYDILGAKIANIGNLQQQVYHLIDSKDVSPRQQLAQQFVNLDKCLVIPCYPKRPLYGIQNVTTGAIQFHSQKNHCKQIMSEERGCIYNVFWFDNGDASNVKTFKFPVQNLCYYGNSSQKLELLNPEALKLLALKNCVAPQLVQCINLECMSLELVSNVDVGSISQLKRLKNVYINAVSTDTEATPKFLTTNTLSSNLKGTEMRYGVNYLPVTARPGVVLLHSLAQLENLESVAIFNIDMQEEITLVIRWKRLHTFQIKFCQYLIRLQLNFIIPILPYQVIEKIQTLKSTLHQKIQKIRLAERVSFPPIELLDCGHDVTLQLIVIKISAFVEKTNKILVNNTQQTKYEPKIENSESLEGDCSMLSSDTFEQLEKEQIVFDKSVLKHNIIKNLLDELKSNDSSSVSMSLPEISSSSQVIYDKHVFQQQQEQQRQIKFGYQVEKKNVLQWETLGEQNYVETYNINEDMKIYIKYKRILNALSSIAYITCKNQEEIMNNIHNTKMSCQRIDQQNQTLKVLKINQTSSQQQA